MPRRRPPYRDTPVPATAPDQRYGQRGEQQAALRAVPTATEPDLPTVIASAQRAPAPTGILEGDSEAPDEPVTAGLPFGPGPGPEALMVGRDNDYAALGPVLPLLELAANQPNASPSMRNLVRRLRGAMPI